MRFYIESNSEYHKSNRENFSKLLLPNSVAIFHSASIYSRSADATVEFQQDPDLYYLTGIDQEETVLVIYPQAKNPKFREILFIKETSDHIRVWEGYKYTQEEAKALSGIDTVMWTSELSRVLSQIMLDTHDVYINLNEHGRKSFDESYKNLTEFQKLKTEYPLHHYHRSAPILWKLRSMKSDFEIEMMRKAAQITRDAFIHILKNFRKFSFEHEIEAELTYIFHRQRATHAYHPIIASGLNSCVLHYNDNFRALHQEDIILFDFGAMYSLFCADLSRTIPVSGRFTPRQRQVYQATLNVFKACRDLIVSGNTLNHINLESNKIMAHELKSIGLIEDINDFNRVKKYFPHGVSHFLGLNVHDVGKSNEELPINSVLTCEPGIYIPEEQIGVRIENDIVAKSQGFEDLLLDCPIEIEEIEDLMNV
jgi:Xaa-Pro aminopeptidase